MRNILIATLALSSIGVATADVVRYDSTGLGQNIDIVFNGQGQGVFAGELNFTNLTTNSALETMCVDLENRIGGGQTYSVNILPTLGLPNFEEAGSVYSLGIASISDNSTAAALQIAVWAARYGTDLSTNSGGTFQLSASWYMDPTNAGTIASAITYRNAAIGNPTNAFYLQPDPAGSGQAQLSTVPEPATLGAIAIGLAALARRRR